MEIWKPALLMMLLPNTEDAQAHRALAAGAPGPFNSKAKEPSLEKHAVCLES